MRYSYDFKRKCVELYRRGKYPDTPSGVKEKSFHDKIRIWVRQEEIYGPEALKHRNQNREWTPEERYALVARVLAGESYRKVAFSAGLNDSQLYNWVRKYKIYGYNGLINQKKGRKSMNPKIKKVGTRKPPKPNESEYEELIRLRTENEYMKAEIEIIKKEIALREQKEAARLKAKKQRLSKNSEKMDSN
jgi:transposase-like protein